MYVGYNFAIVATFVYAIYLYIALECKRNPKKFWQYVNKKTKFKTAVSDLHWLDSNGKQK